MPYETTIRWIALGLLALGVLWVIIAGAGLRPRAMRLRRAIRRSGSATLVCGACGHPAVALGQIESCPECGAVYTRVGLDAPGTAVRWSSPLLLVALVLLGGVAIGTLVLAPWSAGIANRAALGQTHVERIVSRRAFLPNKHDPQTGLPPPIALQIDSDTVQIHHPARNSASLTIGWNPSPPSVPMADILAATVTIQLSVGVGWTEANESWDSKAYPPAQVPTYAFMSGDGDWAAMQAAVSTHVLEVRYNTQRWSMRDPTGRIIDRGVELESGISALYDSCGLGKDQANPWSYAEPSMDDLRSHVEGMLTSGGQQSFDSIFWENDEDAFRPIGHIGPTTTLHRVHPAAPWGLATAIATTTCLAFVALVLLYLSWRSKRRPTTTPAPHP